MSFMPITANSTLSTPQFPSYWRPSDQVLNDLPAIPVESAVAPSNEWVYSQVAAVAKTRVAGAEGAVVLGSSYTSDPFTQVYLSQHYQGLPVLNTQLHCVVAKGSGGSLKIVQCNNSFVDLQKVAITTSDAKELSRSDVASVVKSQFGDVLAAEWLGASFEEKAELGWYFNKDKLTKAWLINTHQCCVVADAASGNVIGFNSFIRN
ncbi:hypothetical protein BDR26DRAFT_869844 [Obelidium mucronatum]|nr:hypothetical protein BDR26DRAFT_869844 [Obelidium mucronatum]